VLSTIALCTLVPLAAALLSGGIAAVRAPGPRLTSGLQHFAAGVVFAATAIELVPAVLERSPWVAVMFTFRHVGARIERGRAARGALGVPVGLIVATGIDFLVDGVILGAGFSAEAQVGVLLTVALAVEYLFVGLSISASIAGTLPTLVVALLPAVLAVLTIGGALGGAVLLGGASAALLAGVLAFGAVAFMYLATEELLVEAHESGETSVGSVGFFVGFLVYLVLSELIS
jgi:ZIP family zinc transporter